MCYDERGSPCSLQLPSRFIPKVNLIKLPSITFHALLNQVPIPVYIDVKILVQFQDALKYPGLFFHSERHFAENKPVIDHPDVMEGKLNAIREMMKGQGMK